MDRQVRELAVTAISDISFAFKELILTFEQQTREQVKLTLGSSGNFYTQIQNSGPFDRYFSADIATLPSRKRLAELYSLRTRDEGHWTVLGDLATAHLLWIRTQ